MYRKAREEICQKDRLIKKLQAELEQKKRIISRANTERLLDREDGRAYPGRSRSEVRKEGRLHLNEDGKGGRKSGTRNYSQMDLEELAKGNDVISNDCLIEMKASHPDWEFVRFDERTSYVVTKVRAHIVFHKVITPGYLATRPDRTTALTSPSTCPGPLGCVKESSTGSRPKSPYRYPYGFTDIRKSPVFQRIPGFLCQCFLPRISFVLTSIISIS